jgi:hypothetical protein
MLLCVQDKVWVDAPDAEPREIYTVLAHAEMPAGDLRGGPVRRHAVLRGRTRVRCPLLLSGATPASRATIIGFTPLQAHVSVTGVAGLVGRDSSRLGGTAAARCPPPSGRRQAIRTIATSCRCSGMGISGSWSSGRGSLGGRPRRRLVARIFPLRNS